MADSGPAVARTWDDVERLMYAAEPANFLLGGDCSAALRFRFPSAREVIDILRKDDETRIVPGRPPEALDGGACTELGTTDGALSILETRDGRHHFGKAVEDEARFAAWFRDAPLDDAIATPFNIAHFQLAKFMTGGGFLEGFDAKVLEPWKQNLRDGGFEFDRCLPYIFISGARDVGSFHHDVSHVVAWQIEGTKRFCGLRQPSRLHPESQRRKHGQTVAPPKGLRETDVLAVEMPAGTVLFNQLLTPHWVQSPLDEVAFSVNLSHGGLRRVGAGRGLCRNEAEHEAYKASDPEIAKMFDIKRGYQSEKA